MALLFIFCFVRLKYRSEILLFLGAFGIGGLVTGVVFGICSFFTYMSAFANAIYIINSVAVVGIDVLFVWLLMREKNPEKGRSRS